MIGGQVLKNEQKWLQLQSSIKTCLSRRKIDIFLKKFEEMNKFYVSSNIFYSFNNSEES